MRAPRIYTGQKLHPNASFELESGPAAHVARALRMRPGDTIRLFNGEGGEYTGSILAVGKKTVQVTLSDHLALEVESPLPLELGIAISRGDRMDLIIQKATELGVTRIAPLTTERTEVRLKGDRVLKKQRHWQQIIISACEQCGRNRLPELHAPTGIDDWLGSVAADRKFVLHHRAGSAENSGQSPASVAILVGPEGGLTGGEIEAASRFGFASLTLGPRVLRTETAPLAAIAILQAKWGDMAPQL